MDNHVVGNYFKGGTIHTDRVAIKVEESLFDNNYMQMHGYYSRGGAISVRSGNIYNTSDYYRSMYVIDLVWVIVN